MIRDFERIKIKNTLMSRFFKQTCLNLDMLPKYKNFFSIFLIISLKQWFNFIISGNVLIYQTKHMKQLSKYLSISFHRKKRTIKFESIIPPLTNYHFCNHFPSIPRIIYFLPIDIYLFIIYLNILFIYLFWAEILQIKMKPDLKSLQLHTINWFVVNK